MKKSGEDIDLCEYFPDLLGGIGHNELRHFWIGENGEIEAESNNVHDTGGRLLQVVCVGRDDGL